MAFLSLKIQQGVCITSQELIYGALMLTENEELNEQQSFQFFVKLWLVNWLNEGFAMIGFLFTIISTMKKLLGFRKRTCFRFN